MVPVEDRLPLLYRPTDLTPIVFFPVEIPRLLAQPLLRVSYAEVDGFFIPRNNSTYVNYYTRGYCKLYETSVRSEARNEYEKRRTGNVWKMGGVGKFPCDLGKVNLGPYTPATFPAQG